MKFYICVQNIILVIFSDSFQSKNAKWLLTKLMARKVEGFVLFQVSRRINDTNMIIYAIINKLIEYCLALCYSQQTPSSV